MFTFEPVEKGFPEFGLNLNLCEPLAKGSNLVPLCFCNPNVHIQQDDRDQVLLVYQRMLTKNDQLYESLVGLARDHGTGASAAYQALRHVTRQAALVRKGRRHVKETTGGPEDYCDEVSTLALNDVGFVRSLCCAL